MPTKLPKLLTQDQFVRKLKRIVKEKPLKIRDDGAIRYDGCWCPIDVFMGHIWAHANRTLCRQYGIGAQLHTAVMNAADFSNTKTPLRKKLEALCVNRDSQ